MLKYALPDLKYVYGHKQAANNLCPGPHLWYNVPYWAKKKLGLTCGGLDYTESNAFGTGQPIPKLWYDDKFDLMGEATAENRAITSALQQINQDFPPP